MNKKNLFVVIIIVLFAFIIGNTTGMADPMRHSDFWNNLLKYVNMGSLSAKIILNSGNHIILSSFSNNTKNIFNCRTVEDDLAISLPIKTISNMIKYEKKVTGISEKEKGEMVIEKFYKDLSKNVDIGTLDHFSEAMHDDSSRAKFWGKVSPYVDIGSLSDFNSTMEKATGTGIYKDTDILFKVYFKDKNHKTINVAISGGAISGVTKQKFEVTIPLNKIKEIHFIE